MSQYHRFFIQKNTELGSPPLVPEIKLHLAVDATELWQMTTKELEDNGLPLPFWGFAWAGGQALARYILDNPQLVEDKWLIFNHFEWHSVQKSNPNSLRINVGVDFNTLSAQDISNLFSKK